jgi:hypothetical protein
VDVAPGYARNFLTAVRQSCSRHPCGDEAGGAPPCQGS